MKPVAFTEDEYRAIIGADRAAWLGGMEAVSGAICLDEAIARALKYNLDHRVRLLELALSAAQLDAGQFDMLPQLLANAGYNWRNKDLIRNSTDSVTGEPSLANPFISSERDTFTADLGLSWSLLDFGLGYYNAKQNADRLLVANERRRKAMHTLIQNVTTTYWRALAGQQLRAQVSQTIREAESALADSREILRSKLQDPEEALRYQRNLLENLRLLENVDRELALAAIDLNTLLGLPPGSEIQLVEPKRSDLRPVSLAMEKLEEIALANNADLKEKSYNARIAAQETRKTLLKMVPGLKFNYGTNYDSDSYLINKEWNQASLTASYNLFNILATPARKRVSDFERKVADSERMAVQVAVLSQLHLAKNQYHDAIRQYRRAESIFQVDSRLSKLAIGEEQTEMGAPLERISREVTQILSSVRMYQSMARVNEASGRIQATMGLEPQIGRVDETILADLRRQVSRSYEQLPVGILHQWNCPIDPPVQVRAP
ncbi:TolC family protein [Thiorhodovibrio winogradskyi]|uniref:TolC family protein n=1 Tax=Thiorhodovibrio winogradskyi TaxID=77007 RepID=UPI002E2A1C05|nr:TolC family protein [Thiorhodovibrio winogradskyi]